MQSIRSVNFEVGICIFFLLMALSVAGLILVFAMIEESGVKVLALVPVISTSGGGFDERNCEVIAGFVFVLQLVMK